MQKKIVRKQQSSKNCFICGVENDFGLKARFYETNDAELWALFTPKDEHQSYPNRMHGGVASAILDETIGRAICVGQDEMIWGVTTELIVKYRKPVPLGQELTAKARITYHRGRFFEGEAELCLPDGTVAASAKGKYIIVPEEKAVDNAFLESEWGYDTPGQPPIFNQESEDK